MKLQFDKFFKRVVLNTRPPALNYDNCNSQTNGEFFFLATYAKSFKFCVDIGANVGDYARKIRDLNHKCRIICFEPNIALKDKILGQGIKEVYAYAVDSKSKKVTLNINVSDPTQSSMYRKNVHTTPLVVESVSIDDFAKHNRLPFISFIKIDTEGNELKVLKGCRNLIKNNAIDFIQFEYGGTYLDAHIKIKDIYELLKKNYIICHLLPSGLLPLEYSLKLENYRYSNWVAISRTWKKFQ